MILRFDGITDNLVKRAISRFIVNICFDNTNYNNKNINFYYFINF